MCEDAAATCSQRRSPRHWGRLEATTRGNATLKLAAEPAWAAAFQPRQAAEDDEVAVPYWLHSSHGNVHYFLNHDEQQKRQHLTIEVLIDRKMVQ